MLAKTGSFDVAATSGDDYKSGSDRITAQIPTSDISNTRKPLMTMQNVDYHRDVERAAKNEILNQNMRYLKLNFYQF